MRERPILFSGAMVRAILSGQKSVTRRACKPQPSAHAHTTSADGNPMSAWWETGKDINHCPYGQPGERLWVRESLRFDPEYGHYYAAGGRHGETVYLCSLFDDEDKQTGPSYDGLLPERSVPSIHLHRRYSRILLEITAVRVERLQDITEQQALAEGVASCAQDLDPDGNGYSPGELFSILWSSINGTDSWNSNPWVWVVDFKRVEVPA
ncbi:hypothetical protein [Ectopseudomonas guguanensis]|uniref:hypothetical protein n=1 Tax=Ectopseudomonas guguanensis TaxID=1198456 RepID=UPI002858465A|nr:hypothetical protein [Pseudomonas guguanensis]MDR8014069.1 hypothetical protein [Pseudomonas guguanensis]